MDGWMDRWPDEGTGVKYAGRKILVTGFLITNCIKFILSKF
jgi:hypothetical protein